MQIKLIKEPDNEHDKEAIKAVLEPLGTIGYVANSPYTVLGECMSAGRLLTILDEIPSAVRRYGNHFLASLLCIPKYNFYENISKGCYAPQIRQGLD